MGFVEICGRGTSAEFTSFEVIGVYITAGTRIHLYRYLDLLQKKAIYCDTVSVIFIQPRDEHELIETGDKLGDMTSELKPTEYQNLLVVGRRIMHTK